jgi:hypothetical protein
VCVCVCVCIYIYIYFIYVYGITALFNVYFITKCFIYIKNEDILITGHGLLYGCEMMMIAHCLDNWLTEWLLVLRAGRYLLPRKIFSDSGTHFC